MLEHCVTHRGRAAVAVLQMGDLDLPGVATLSGGLRSERRLSASRVVSLGTAPLNAVALFSCLIPSPSTSEANPVVAQRCG